MERRNVETSTQNPDPDRLWRVVDDKDERKGLGRLVPRTIKKRHSKLRNPNRRKRRWKNRRLISSLQMRHLASIKKIHQAHLQQEKRSKDHCLRVLSAQLSDIKSKTVLRLHHWLLTNAPNLSSMVIAVWRVYLGQIISARIFGEKRSSSATPTDARNQKVIRLFFMDRPST